MIQRTTTRTVTFAHPFTLSGVDEVQPAGNYTVEIDEELIQTLSFPAYRSTGTWFRLPSQGGIATATRAVKVTPTELGEALAKDAMVASPEAVSPSADRLSADPAALRPARSMASMRIGVLHKRFRCLSAYVARIWRR